MYLLALVCHQDVFARGINGIHHFQNESYYKALLHADAGKFLSLKCVGIPCRVKVE